MKSRRVQQLKCYTISNKTFLRANLSTFENQKIASHCRIASGVYGPLGRCQTLGLKMESVLCTAAQTGYL